MRIIEKQRYINLFKVRLLRYIPDKMFIKYMYYKKKNRRLDLKNPKTFNEKLQWLKLYDRKPEYTTLVDKYRVRQFISDTIGGEYLIPLIGVYNNFDEIDFQDLPDGFVLKCTHDSGGVVICKDKKKFNKNEARKKINNSLKENYYYAWREWPYKNVKPRIICEKYMEDGTGELKDYKLMCFNGEVKCIFVCLNRNSSSGLNIDIFNAEWELLPFRRNCPNSGENIERPKNLEKMISLAEELSKNVPFLRVDFYDICGQIYFGELTFYPEAGYGEFNPESYDELLGSWIKLPGC